MIWLANQFVTTTSASGNPVRCYSANLVPHQPLPWVESAYTGGTGNQLLPKSVSKA